MSIDLTKSEWQKLAFKHFVDFLCLAECHLLATETIKQGDCPIACLLISKLVLEVWQKSLETADFVLIAAFNNLPEPLRLELLMQLDSKEDLAADFSDLARLLQEFRALDKLAIANKREANQDIFGHCECLILKSASERYHTRRFSDYKLYVNVEPCLLCSAALVTAQLGELYFLVENQKAGAVCSQIKLLNLEWLNHHVTWSKCNLPYLADITSKELKAFFLKLRARNKHLGNALERKQLYARSGKLTVDKSNDT